MRHSQILDIDKIRQERNSKKFLSIKQICEKYFIGDKTARGIVEKVMDAQAYWRSMNDKMEGQRLNGISVKRTIEKWVNSEKDEVTIKKIRLYLKERLKFDIPWHQIKKHLRTTMKLSYKKGWEIRVDIDQNRLHPGKHTLDLAS